MEKNVLLDKIKGFQGATSIEMFFCTNENQIFKSKLSPNIKKKLINTYIEACVVKIDRKNNILEYDFNGNFEDDIIMLSEETLNKNENYSILKSNLKDLTSSDVTVESKAMQNALKNNFNSLKCIVLKLNYDNNELLIYKKFYAPRKLAEKSTIVNKYTLDVYEDDIYSIDNNISAIEYKNYAYIFSNSEFEGIFNFKDFYVAKYEKEKYILENANLLSDFEIFDKKLKNNKILTIQMLKKLNGEYYNMLKTNFDKVAPIINEYYKSLVCDFENKQIIINKDTPIKNVINALNNKLAKLVLTDENVIADKTSKPQND